MDAHLYGALPPCDLGSGMASWTSQLGKLEVRALQASVCHFQLGSCTSEPASPLPAPPCPEVLGHFSLNPLGGAVPQHSRPSGTSSSSPSFLSNWAPWTAHLSHLVLLALVTPLWSFPHQMPIIPAIPPCHTLMSKFFKALLRALSRLCVGGSGHLFPRAPENQDSAWFISI